MNGLVGGGQIGALPGDIPFPINRMSFERGAHARTYLQAREIRHVFRHRQDEGMGAGVRPGQRAVGRPADGLDVVVGHEQPGAPPVRDAGGGAKDYAADHGIDAVVVQPKARKPNIRPRGYGENFATDRRGAWTH
jgi:hypothetical protein